MFLFDQYICNQARFSGSTGSDHHHHQMRFSYNNFIHLGVGMKQPILNAKSDQILDLSVENLLTNRKQRLLIIAPFKGKM